MDSSIIIKNLKKIIFLLIKIFLVLTIFVICAMLLFGWWASKGTFSISKFDPEIWFAKQTEETDSTCYRGNMAFDIRDNVLVKGMTKEQVSSKLGEPDSLEENEYQYILGMCSGFRIDYDVLHVYFENGHLNDAQVYQH